MSPELIDYQLLKYKEIHFNFRIASDDLFYFNAHRKLRDIGEMLNKGWKPDWTNGEKKWFIYYKGQSGIINDKLFSFDYRVSDCVSGVVYFRSGELAEKAIKIMGDDLKYL